MVDEDDGDGMPPLQVPQVGEQWRDLATDVLVDLVEADEGIEDEQAWFETSDGLVEAGAVGIEVEAQAGGGDHLDIEIGEIAAGGGADAVEPAPHDMQGILGGIEEDAAWPLHGEAAQAGRAGGDGDGKVEGEEGFAAFRLAADDADGFLGPQGLDQPALFLSPLGEGMGRSDRKPVHRRLAAAPALLGLAVKAQASKSSASSMRGASRSAAATNSSSAMIIRLRRLPCAWSASVVITSGVISANAPASVRRWRRQAWRASGVARSIGRRTRIRLSSGRNSSERRRSTRRPSPASTMVSRMWESSLVDDSRRSSERTEGWISWASSTMRTGLESAPSICSCQR